MMFQKQRGAVIQTLFGKGTVEDVDDDTICVNLDFGFLYAPPRTLLVLEEEDEDDEAAVSDKGNKNATFSNNTKKMMDLEVAYHALEMMRKQNLQVDCSQQQQQQQQQHHQHHHNNNNRADLDRCCSTCLLDHNNSKKKALLLPNKALEFLQSVMPCMQQSFWEEQLVQHVNSFIQEQQIAQLQHIPRGNPCLSCGAPACPRHTSKSLQLDNNSSLAVCLVCEPLLNIDSVIEKLLSTSACANKTSRRSRADERRAYVNRLVERYDRLLMRLQCFEPFLVDLASFLDNEEHEGSRSEENVCGWNNHSNSTTQSTSGFLSAGLADWILASYHLLQSLLVVTGTAFTRAHILLTAKEDQDKEEEHDGNDSQRGKNAAPWTSCPHHDPSDGNNLGVPSSNNLGGAMTETALKSLSNATLSEKARTLRRLYEDLDVFPSTASITEGCQVFLSALAEHEHGLKVQALSTFLAALQELSCLEPTAGYFLEQQQQQQQQHQSQEGVREESSLYERIEQYQQRRGSVASSTSSLSSATATAPDADTKAAVEEYLYNQRMKMYQVDRRERSSSITSSSGTDNIIVADPIIDDDDNGKCPRRESATSTTSITSVTTSSSSSLVGSNNEFNNKPLAGNKKARRNSLLHRISLHKQRQRESSASPSVQLPELEPQQQW